MTIPSPLQHTIEEYKVEYAVPTKPDDRVGASTGEFRAELLSEFVPWGDGGCCVLATAGIVELEYSALQKSAGIFDAVCRGTIKVTGKDRLDCINRLTTKQLTDLNVGKSKSAFFTSRKGTVIADAVVHALEDSILLEVDCTVVEQLCNHMTSYVVMEDVHIEDVTETTHWLWIIGPTANTFAGNEQNVFPFPLLFLGMPGFAIAVSPSDTIEVWNTFVQQGVRPIGWYALNMARVECGIPMFMIDFDTNNLPHETSLIQSRVQFDKGCYLGQEIVARMESLGQPKQRLVQLRMQTDELPVAGSQIWENEKGEGTPIGVVTSSAISPLLGGVPCIIAMVGKKFAKVHNEVFLYIGETIYCAQVLELQSLNREHSA